MKKFSKTRACLWSATFVNHSSPAGRPNVGDSLNKPENSNMRSEKTISSNFKLSKKKLAKRKNEIYPQSGIKQLNKFKDKHLMMFKIQFRSFTSQLLWRIFGGISTFNCLKIFLAPYWDKTETYNYQHQNLVKHLKDSLIETTYLTNFLF